MKTKVLNKKWKDRIFIFTLIILPITHFFVFWLYVNLSSIMMAFQNMAGNFTLEWFSLFVDELTLPDSNISTAIVNTLKYFLVTNFINTPIGYIAAYFFYKKIFGYKAFRVIFFLPGLISGVIMTSLYSSLIAPDGAIGIILQKIFGMKEVPIFLADSRYATNAMLIYMIWVGIGGNLILFSSAMSRIPAEIIESGQIDGVNMVQEIWYFIIPLTMSTLVTVMTLAVAGLFMSSGPILLLTQGRYETYTLDYWIYEKVTGYSKNLNYASAVGLIFTMIGVPITLLSRKLLSKLDSGVQY